MRHTSRSTHRSSETAKNLIPTVPAVTNGTAYVRFHGRNLSTWNKRGGSAAERFDYLYSDEELGEWVPTLKELARQSPSSAFAFFNNNSSSEDPQNPLGRISQAAANAQQLRRLLDVNRIPATGGGGVRSVVHILSVIHGTDARAELFAPVVEEAGHRLDEWSFGWGTPPPRPLDAYDAVLVFGGAMHADQDAHHPWLREETLWLQQVLAGDTPVLGVCLGVQLLARAAGAGVGRMQDGPEIGWHRVELTEAGLEDPVIGVLPAAFDALQWHHYTYGLPAGAVELARSTACTQAFRLGDACWGVQFHPEVTSAQLESWLADTSDPAPDPDGLRAETREQIAVWNDLGRSLCGAFLAAAERLASARLQTA